MAKIVLKRLVELISNRRWDSLKDEVKHVPAPDVCELLFLSVPHDRVLIFRALSRELSAEVFAYLDSDDQDALLELLTNSETRQLLASLSPDDRTELLEELPSPITRKLMGLLNSDDLEEARQLLGYPEESVGRIMTPDYVKVRSHWTVRQSLDHIRFYGKDRETVNVLYVVDNRGRLLDSIRLRTLILSELEQTIDEIREHSSISLSAFSDQEEAVMIMQKYDRMALPVVDSEGELIGIVTFDDVMDIAEEEATEDMQKSASVNPLKISYHRAGFGALYSKRVGWLIVLVVLSILSSSVIAGYSDALSEMAILFAFVPLLLGAGGNAGSQAATLVIRALVTGDIELNDIFKTALKEISVGFLLGITLGVVAAVIAFYRSQGGVVSPTDAALVVGSSMLSIVVVANMIGMSFPFILSKLGIDPAVASAPLIATLTDVTGLIIYFNIAVAIIHIV
jgi:magnesium transporter